MLKKARLIFRAMRPNQWIKNLVVYTALIFSGNLFNLTYFLQNTIAFFLMCATASVCYLLNDIVDYEYDIKHPAKKFRPIASGEVNIPEATFVMFFGVIVVLLLSLVFNKLFFVIICLFLIIQIAYTLHFKKRAVMDIFLIATLFVLRALAGRVVSGSHIQIWLMMTIFFVALFIASVKRHAELLAHGDTARKSLSFYKDRLLYLYVTVFATLTIVSYSLWTFLEPTPLVGSPISKYFSWFFPSFEGRKWMMVTIPVVVYGVARYAQLLYEKDQGEKPEDIIRSDKPLLVSMIVWGLMVVFLIYVF